MYLISKIKRKLFKSNQTNNSDIQNIEKKETDIYITSYPRSGNTWLRLLISDIILQNHGFITDTKLPIHADSIIPDIHCHNINDVDARISLPYRLIKSHNIESNPTGRLIFLFRNPVDVLVSYYYFHLRYDHRKHQVSEGIDQFCLSKLQDWQTHINTAIQIKKNLSNKILFISYDALHNHPINTLTKVMNFYDGSGFTISETTYEQAVVNHKIQNHQKIENLEGYNERFFREGKINGGARELSNDTLTTIKNFTEEQYEEACSFAQLDDEQYQSPNNLDSAKES